MLGRTIREQGLRAGAFAVVFALAVALVCAVTVTGCSGSSDPDEGGTGGSTGNGVASSAAGETCTIGVAVYDPTDPEMTMFFDYYTGYIAESFPVEFIISNELASYEDEVEFIEAMADEGAGAIIAFYTTDLAETVAACEDRGIYLVLGSSSISDEEYEAVKDNEYFLGVIGPDEDEEYAAGYEMAQEFVEGGATSYLITSGGAASSTNYMHYTRTVGMLTALQDELGLTYSSSIEELASSEELVEVDTGTDVTITIAPWYFATDEGLSNLETAFEAGDYDALLSAFSVDDALDLIEEEIEQSATEMLVGTIDCFSESNYLAVETVDANGNSLLNYVKGKYASMVAPAFVAAYNAVTGNVDVVKPDGEAFRLYQTYWTATSEEEYVELYNYTRSIYENAYSSADLMEVIAVYNEDAGYEAFAQLTESCDEEAVRARLG